MIRTLLARVSINHKALHESKIIQKSALVMPFFKKLKDRFTQPNAEVILQLSKNNFALGENVEGTLTATSNEEFECEEIRLEIQCEEKKKTSTWQYDPVVKMRVMKTTDETANLWSARDVLSGPVQITQGFSKTFPVNVNIPAGCRPTFLGVDDNVSWIIKGVIAVKGRPDIISKTFDLQVTLPNVAPVVKEIIREVVMIPCKFCGTLMPQIEVTCPNCGAKRTG
jgi:hypothetical protein